MTLRRPMMFIAAALLATLSTAALADAASAKNAYYRTLERWHYDIAREPGAVARTDTLVRGVYRLEDRASGAFIALITERGDVRGDANGWSHVGADGMQSFSDDEAAQMRDEVMRAVAWDALIEVAYGDGGGRRLILLSAVDCPFCARLETNLAQTATSLRTTLYVLPSALASLDADGPGQRAWSQAAALWCAADAAASWRGDWRTQTLPQTEGCALDATAAQRAVRNFVGVMASIGARVRGTPALIREDATLIAAPAGLDAAALRATLGPDALPSFHSPMGDTRRPVWLR